MKSIINSYCHPLLLSHSPSQCSSSYSVSGRSQHFAAILWVTDMWYCLLASNSRGYMCVSANGAVCLWQIVFAAQVQCSSQTSYRFDEMSAAYKRICVDHCLFVCGCSSFSNVWIFLYVCHIWTLNIIRLSVKQTGGLNLLPLVLENHDRHIQLLSDIHWSVRSMLSWLSVEMNECVVDQLWWFHLLLLILCSSLILIDDRHWH